MGAGRAGEGCVSGMGRREYSGPPMALEETIPPPAADPGDRMADLAAARRMLPLVSRTFAINIRVLGRPMRDSVRLAYLLCRACDALEDSWPGSPAEVAGRFDLLLEAIEGRPEPLGRLARAASEVAGDRADLRVLATLPAWMRLLAGRPAREAEAVRDGVRVMAAGMRRFAVRAAERAPSAPYLDDAAELTEYCHVVAGCVGEMLTRLHQITSGLPEDAGFAERMRLAPRVGEGLQLTNILLDWPADLTHGRSHLPERWLAVHGLSAGDLSSAPPHVARELALRLAGHAHAALDRVADYLDLVPRAHVRYRLFVLWPALWARASLRTALADPRFPSGGARPRLTRAALWSSAARSLTVAASHTGVRRLLEAPAR